MTNSEQCREAFEKWCSTQNAGGITPIRQGDNYFHRESRIAWAAWQAAWNTRPQVSAEVVDALRCAECSLEQGRNGEGRYMTCAGDVALNHIKAAQQHLAGEGKV